MRPFSIRRRPLPFGTATTARTEAPAPKQIQTEKSCHHTPLQIKSAQGNSPCERPFRSMKMLAALSFLCLFAASSALATVVSWSLDPNGTAGHCGFRQPRFPLVELFNHGKRLCGRMAVAYPARSNITSSAKPPRVSSGWPAISGSENGYFSTQSVQLDVNSILPQGVTDEKLQLGSVQSTSNDAFAILELFHARRLGSANRGNQRRLFGHGFREHCQFYER